MTFLTRKKGPSHFEVTMIERKVAKGKTEALALLFINK